MPLLLMAASCAPKLVDPFPSFPASGPEVGADLPVLTAPRPVTFGLEHQYDARLTPDGRFLVLTAEKDHSAEITRIEIGSLRRRNLSRHSSTDEHPVLSPDGGLVAFVSRRDDATGALYTAPIETQLDFLPDFLTGYGLERIEGPTQVVSAEWMPDGGWLVVSGDPESPEGTRLEMMAEDGEVRAITPNVLQPTLSPDGRWVAAIRERRLVVVMLESGEVSIAFPGQPEIMDRDPAFHPDGRWIYLARNDEDTNGDGRLGPMDNPALFRAAFDPETGRVGPPRKLTTNAHAAMLPRLTGDQIYYTSDRGGTLNIWRLPLSGQVPDGWDEMSVLAAAGESRRPEEARLWLDSLIPSDSRMAQEISFLKGESWRAAGRSFWADREYRRTCAGTDDPGYWCGRARLARLEMRKEGGGVLSHGEIMDEVQDVLDDHPDDPEIQALGFLARGRLLSALDRDSAALADFDRVLTGFGDYRRIAASAQLEKSRLFARHFAGDPRPLLDAYRKVIVDYPEQEMEAETAAREVARFVLESPLNEGRRVENLRALYQESGSLPYLPATLQIAVASQLQADGNSNAALEALLKVPADHGMETRLVLEAISQMAPLVGSGTEASNAAQVITEWAEQADDPDAARNALDHRNGILLAEADAQYREGNLVRALELYESLTRQEGEEGNLGARRGVVLCLAGLGRLAGLPPGGDSAGERYQRALALSFGDSDDQEEALDILLNLIRIMPDSPYPFMATAWLYESRATRLGLASERFKALENYLAAFNLPSPPGFAPLRADLRLTLSMLLTRLGNYAKAIRYFEAREKDPTPYSSPAQRVSFLEQWHYSLYRMGDYDGARVKLAEAIGMARSLGRTEWWNSLEEALAFLYYDQGRWSEARSIYEGLLQRLTEDDPNIPAVQKNIALANVQEKRPRESLRWLSEAYAQADTPWRLPEPGFWGNLLVGKFQLRSAINKQDYSLAPQGFDKAGTQRLLVSLLARGSGELGMRERMSRYASLKLAMIPDEVSKTSPAYLVAERASIRNQQALEAFTGGWPERARDAWELAALEARRSTQMETADAVLVNRASAIALNPGYGDVREREEVLADLDQAVNALIEAEKRTDNDLVRLIRFLNARAMLNAAQSLDQPLWPEAPTPGSQGYEDVRRTLATQLTYVRMARADLDLALSLVSGLPEDLAGGWPALLRVNREGLSAKVESEIEAVSGAEVGPQLPEGGAEGLLWREEDVSQYRDRMRPLLLDLIEQERWIELADMMEVEESATAASDFRRAWRAGLSEWMESEDIRQWEAARSACPPVPMQCAAMREASQKFRAGAPSWLTQRWLGLPVKMTDVQWILEPGDLAIRMAWLPPYLVAVRVSAHEVGGAALRLDRFLADGQAGPIGTADYQQLLEPLVEAINDSKRLYLALDETVWNEPWTSLPWEGDTLSEHGLLAFGPDLATLVRSHEARRVGLQVKAHLTRRISPTLQLGQAVYSPLTAVLPDVVSSLLPNPIEWLGMLGEYLATPDLISLQGLDSYTAQQIMERSNLLWIESLQPVVSNPYLTGVWVGMEEDPLAWMMPAALGPRSMGATMVVLEADWDSLPDKADRGRWVRAMARMGMNGGASSILMSTYGAPCSAEGMASADGVLFEEILSRLPEMSVARSVWSVTRNHRPSELVTCDAAPHVRLIGHWGQEPEASRNLAAENLPRVQSLALDLFKKGRFEEAAAEFREGLSYLSVLGKEEGRDKFLQALVASYFKDGRIDLAIEAQQRLVDALTQVPDQAGVAEALLKLGNLLQQKGDRAASQASFRASLDQAQGRMDKIGEARAWLAIGGQQEEEGEYEVALESLGSARQALADQDPRLGASIERGRGRILFQRLSRNQDALPAYNDAMSLARKAGDKALEAAVLSDIGLVYERQFRFAEAVAAQQQSQQMFSALGASDEVRRMALQCRIYEANARFLGGELNLAASMAGEAREKAREMGAQDLEKFATNLAGLAALYQGDFDKALNDQQANLALAMKSGREMDVAAAWNNLGRVWRDQGKWDRARNAYEAALAIDRRLGDAAGLSFDYRHLGRLAILEGRWKEARDLLMQALNFARASSQKTNELEALADLIWLDWKEGRPEEAFRQIPEAMELAARSVDPDHWRVEFRLHRLLGMLGEGEDRKESWRQAAALLEDFWIWDPSAWAFMQARTPNEAPLLLDDWRGLYDDLVLEAISRGKTAEASAWMERWRWLRARAWYARHFQPIPIPAPDSEDYLWSEAHSLVRRRTALRNLAKREQAAALAQWEQDRKRWEKDRRDLSRSDPAAAARLGETQQMESPAGRWLEFWTTEGKLLRIAHDAGDLKVEALPVGRSELAVRLAGLSRKLESWAPLDMELEDLSGHLLAGLEWPGSKEELTLIADEHLSGMPWASLPAGGAVRLGEIVALRMLPWRQTLPAGLDSGPSGEWLAVSGMGAEAGQPDPPMGRTEAGELKRIHKDTHVVSNMETGWLALTVQSALRQLDRIHLAVHEQEEDRSRSLRLSPARSLTIKELFSRPAPARSIALSACRSGASLAWPDVSPAEALLFMGAAEVEATAWRIGDVETALVFKHYYRQRAKGLSGPDALSEAQLAVEAYHPHPAAWAGVIWMGGDAASAPRSGKTPRP